MAPRGEHIAIFIPAFYGGVAAVMTALANELAKRGHGIEVIAVRSEGRMRERLDPGVTIVELDCERTLFALPGLLRYLRSRRPRVLISAALHLNCIAVLAARLLFLQRLRVIATEHSAMRAAIEESGPLHAALLPLLARMVYRLSERLVCCSEGIRGEAIREFGLPPEKVVTIYNPIVTPAALMQLDQEPDVTWATPDRGSVPESKEAPAQEHGPLVVTMGRLAPQKDQATLLRAFARLCEQRPARLLIFGVGPLQAELETLARELGITTRLRFAGFTQRPIACLKQADLFVLSSAFEGFPTVLVEALLAGLPIVSTDCEFGPRELLAESKQGWLVPVGDAEALAAAMHAALDDAIDPAAQHQSALAFTAERSAHAYETLLGTGRSASEASG